MKKTLIFTIACLCLMMDAIASDKQETKQQSVYSTDLPAYVIYDAQGQMVSFADMMDELSAADVCLFGEQHNDPISHWLELSVAKGLYQKKGQDLVMGAEMFESDNQLLMDEMVVNNFIDMGTYVAGSILWPNFTTDYKPLVVFAQSAGLKFVCTNIPRRYANIVYKKGVEYVDSLSTQAKSYLPELPIHYNLEERTYKDMAASFPSDEQYAAMKGRMPGAPQAMMASKPSNLVKAQAIKDATMAHFILENWKPGKLFYHFHGEFHSANYSGICYYLKYYNPEVKYKTISVSKSDNPLSFDAADSRADFNVVVKDDMTQTYESN